MWQRTACFCLVTSILCCVSRGAVAQDEPVLSHEVPGDVHIRDENRDTFSQVDFDKYSWDTFLGLSWPAKIDGTPLPNDLPGKIRNHRTVWGAWIREYEVFLPGGARPKNWGGVPFVPQQFAEAKVKLEEKSLRGFKSLFDHPDTAPIGQFSKLTADSPVTDNDKMIDISMALKDRSLFLATSISKGSFSSPHEGFQTEQAFDNGPLVDRQGHYVRLEILINKPMFDYILDNELYSIEGQKQFSVAGKNISFPCGHFKLDSSGTVVWDDKLNRPKTEAVGAVMLKAAWKILTDDEIASGRFHMRGGAVCTPHPEYVGNDKDHIGCAVLGLVGLHIVHKSENMPQWVWSTFEHVDNCPDAGQEENGSYSFYEPHSRLGINHKLPRPWDAFYPDGAEGIERRSKIVRVKPIAPETVRVNHLYQEQLRKINPKNVWQYYELVSTQWPTRPAQALADRTDPDHCNSLVLAPADLLGHPAPKFLANTTMESFIQGRVPNVSSSCMECHANATAKHGKFADFTYLLIRAKGAK